jgi:hypothetical protein
LHFITCYDGMAAFNVRNQGLVAMPGLLVICEMYSCYLGAWGIMECSLLELMLGRAYSLPESVAIGEVGRAWEW